MKKSKRICKECGAKQPNPPICFKTNGKITKPCCFVCGGDLIKHEDKGE